MRVEHITFGGSAITRDTQDISPLVKELFKPFQQDCVTRKIDKTPFTCKIIIENNIAVFDLLVDDNLICTNLCCFAKEDKEPVLLYVKNMVQQISPTTILTMPKEEHFFVTIMINPFAAIAHLGTAGEIEFYIYDAIYEGLRNDNSVPLDEENLSQGTIFEVGKLFPWDKYIGIGDQTLAVLNKAFFDVVVSFTGPTTEEIKAFRKGKLEVGLFPYKNVPFLYLDFGRFSVDLTIDINKIRTEEEKDNWLNESAKVINLFFIDGDTGILKAQRLISINFSDEIRDVLEEQTALTSEETDNIITEVTNRFTTAQIQRQATKKMVFK